MHRPRFVPPVRDAQPGSVLTLAIVRGLAAMADGLMVPFVVIWAIDQVGLSVQIAGLMFLAQAVGESAGAVLGGLVADRLGHRRILLVSLSGMAVGYGVLGLVHQGTAAFALFFVAGLFESVFHPTIAALVSETTSIETRRRGYAAVRTGAGVGRIVGPVLGAGIAIWSLSSVFAAAGLMLVVTLVVAWGMIPRPKSETSRPDRAVRTSDMAVGRGASSSLSTVVRDWRFGALVLGCGSLSITHTWWQADGLVLLNQQTDVGARAFGLLFAVEALAVVLFQVPMIRLTERFQSGTMILLGAAAQGAGLLTLCAAPAGYPVLVAAALLIAAGQMLYGPIASTLVSEVAPPGHVAVYQGALSVSEDIGASLGPTSGLLMGAAGPPGFVWVLAAPTCVLAGAVSRSAGHRPSVLPETFSVGAEGIEPPTTSL